MSKLKSKPDYIIRKGEIVNAQICVHFEYGDETRTFYYDTIRELRDDWKDYKTK